MTNYNVDTELLEDGEHVLWAFGDLAPKKSWKYSLWVSALLILLFGTVQVYNAVKTWESLKESSQELWGMIAIGILVTLIGLGAIMRGNRKKPRPEQQSEYFVGMITNKRMVLYSATREQDIVLRRGDIEEAHLDYSNGARALRLDLSKNSALAQVVFTTSGDILTAKKLLEDRFIMPHAAGPVEDERA